MSKLGKYTACLDHFRFCKNQPRHQKNNMALNCITRIFTPNDIVSVSFLTTYPKFSEIPTCAHFLHAKMAQIFYTLLENHTLSWSIRWLTCCRCTRSRCKQGVVASTRSRGGFLGMGTVLCTRGLVAIKDPGQM